MRRLDSFDSLFPDRWFDGLSFSLQSLCAFTFSLLMMATRCNWLCLYVSLVMRRLECFDSCLSWLRLWRLELLLAFCVCAFTCKDVWLHFPHNLSNPLLKDEAELHIEFSGCHVSDCLPSEWVVCTDGPQDVIRCFSRLLVPRAMCHFSFVGGRQTNTLRLKIELMSCGCM